LKKECLWTNEYSLKEQEKFVRNAILERALDARNQIGEIINTILSAKDELLVQIGRKIKMSLEDKLSYGCLDCLDC